MHERFREGDAEHGGDGADADGEPQPVHALGERAAQVAGPDVPGDAGGGAVGQEDAEPDRGLEDGPRDAEAGQGGGAEVAHDGRVGEQEERLGDQGEEGGNGETPDLAVRGGGHGPTLVRVRDKTASWS